MKLKIICGNTPYESRVIDKDTGKEIRARKVNISLTPENISVVMDIIPDELEIDEIIVYKNKIEKDKI